MVFRRRKTLHFNENKSPRKSLRAVFCVFLVGLLIFLFFRIFWVSTIIIKDGDLPCVTQEVLKGDLKQLKTNLVLLDTREVKKRILEKYICIKLLKITKVYPSTVLVNVSARQPVLVLDKLVQKDELAKGSKLLQVFEGSRSARLLMATSEASPIPTLSFPEPAASVSARLLIDEDGVVFEENPGQISAPLVQGYFETLKLGDRLDTRIVKNSKDIFDKLKELKIESSIAKLVDSMFLLVITAPTDSSRGMKLIFGLDGQQLRELASLQLILQRNRIDLKSIDTLDLRFDKPIVTYVKKGKP